MLTETEIDQELARQEAAFKASFGDDDLYAAYEAWVEKEQAEYEREQAHGGRCKCVNGCGYEAERHVTPGPDPTVYTKCRVCEHVEF